MLCPKNWWGDSGVRVEFLNPFVTAGFRVLETELGLEVSAGKPSLLMSDVTIDAVTVLFNVEGEVEGLAMYAMDLGVAKRLVHHMVGEPVSIFDPIGESALGEMGNLVTGLATIEMERAGFPSNISPPKVLVGSGVSIAAVGVPIVQVPLQTSLGEIHIHLSLTERIAA